MNKKTRLIHNEGLFDKYTKGLSTAVHQASTFEQKAPGELIEGFEYSRSKNPTRSSLETYISNLENGHSGFAFASGMAAITAVLSLLDSGDHIIVGSDVYGGTYRVLTSVFNRFGIEHTLVDTTDENEINSSVREETKMIFIETPSNPLLKVTDIRLIADIAGKNNLISVVDNTFMTPYFQNPMDFGADIVLHSATKYLGGHSDVVAGVVITNEAYSERIGFIQNSTGGVLGPQDSFLLIRGMKTLGLRMEQIQKNTLEIVERLQNHTAVEKVYHPSVQESLNHDIHNSQAAGHTGVVSFDVGSLEKAKQVVDQTEIFTLAESLGAVESLISVPSQMTHASIPKEKREEYGITDGLIRLSVGIEDTEDLVDDLMNALENL